MMARLRRALLLSRTAPGECRETFNCSHMFLHALLLLLQPD